MTYFIQHQHRVRLPVGIAGEQGLRRAQRGAVHAIASHFSLRSTEPAIVVMPTGSGKTGVLMLTPFLVDAGRVLVVTPSRLVRTQIVDQIGQLSLLRDLGAIEPGMIDWPEVREVEKRIVTMTAWEDLRSCDIVVGTPSSVSPALEDVPTPPADLFDLILVDEAHHSAASTWNVLLAAFPEAKRVLFTATPFRRDRQEILGNFVYTYPISQARDDRIFGTIRYLPVDPDPVHGNDRAIALRAEQILRDDRAAGFNHFLMVRTDTKKRAGELAEIYQQQTQLRLRVVHSDLTYGTIKQTIKKLRAHELDGIIAVNMLGEGFDFPNLKIAAIHAPHKSLAVTLQFIGRFARTNAPDIGEAKFLAIPSDIKIEADRIYDEGAVWQEIVPNLHEKSVEREVRVREVLQTFVDPDVAEERIADVSLYALHPYHHVKIYEVSGDVDLQADLDLGPSMSVVYRNVSEARAAAVFITVERSRPRWSSLPVFSGKPMTSSLSITTSQRACSSSAPRGETTTHTTKSPRSCAQAVHVG